MTNNNDEPTYSNAELWQEHQAMKVQLETMQVQRNEDFNKICMLERLLEEKNRTIEHWKAVDNALSDTKSQLKSVETGRLSSTYQSNGDEHVLTDEQAAVLSYLNSHTSIAAIDTVYKHTIADYGDLGQLKLRGCVEQEIRLGSICYKLTDTGRAALEAYREHKP